MKVRRVCERCRRERFEDRLVRHRCIHGTYYLCGAKATCKAVARDNRRQA